MSAEPKTAPREIDFSLPFFPASLTTLFHVPSWRLLDHTQQIRYTQLYALYLNEQTAFFEELLATFSNYAVQPFSSSLVEGCSFAEKDRVVGDVVKESVLECELRCPAKG